MYTKENQTIAEFIELCKAKPCLWKVKCSEYNDRRKKKDVAYYILCDKLKEIEPGATKYPFVQKSIV